MFDLAKNGTNIRRELTAGLVTFLTMAYIIVVNPAVLSGQTTGSSTGMPPAALMAATCIAAALASAVMGLVGRYPIAQAPGMGENFFFVVSTIPAAAAISGHGTPWQIALGVVFWSGVLFLLLTLTGLRERLLDAVSPSMKCGIAAGIGLFIAFIGLKNAGVIVENPGTFVKLNEHWGSPDLIVFFVGLLLTAGLQARRVPGAIFWGLVGSTLLALGLRAAMPHLPAAWREAKFVVESGLLNRFKPTTDIVSAPPSIEPLLFKLDLRGALERPMWAHIGVFFFMVVFDTLGTLIAVARQANLLVGGRLPRARRAMLSDAVGTVAGACLGTSTVTSYIESASGVAYGGRTGLTALSTAGLFLAALWFSPLAVMIGAYAPIYTPALVVVGAMMLKHAAEIAWDDFGEAFPAFLAIIGIPLSYSIADGLALALVAYPIVKVIGGARRDVSPASVGIALLLVGYFVWLR
jgi:AGZA family xanthine/uracil permease-like MFS transporter